MRRPICISILAAAALGLMGFGISTPQGKESGLFSTQPAGLNGKDKSRSETITEDWRGTWQVSVAYRDHETGIVMGTDISTTSICPGEAILPASLGRKAACATRTSDQGISALCGAIQLAAPGCVVFIDALLDTHRSGEVWSGTGSWRALLVGACAHPEPKNFKQNTFGEDFVVNGTRISNHPNCDTTRPSLLESVFARPELSPVLGGNQP